MDEIECKYCSEFLNTMCPGCGGTKKMPWIYNLIKPEKFDEWKIIDNYMKKFVNFPLDLEAGRELMDEEPHVLEYKIKIEKPLEHIQMKIDIGKITNG